MPRNCRRWRPGSRRPTSAPTCRSCPMQRSPASLAKLVEASKIVDALFLRQVWAGNERDAARPGARPVAGRPRAAALLPDQQGPWSRLDHNQRVRARRAGQARAARISIPPARRRPSSRRWIQSLPEAERARATGFFTVIRRAGQQLRHRAATTSNTRASSSARPRCCARPRRWPPSRP